MCHSMTLKYSLRGEHFSFKGMAGTQLAVLDNNHNPGRNQAVIQKGQGMVKHDTADAFEKCTSAWLCFREKEQHLFSRTSTEGPSIV